MLQDVSSNCRWICLLMRMRYPPHLTKVDGLPAQFGFTKTDELKADLLSAPSHSNSHSNKAPPPSAPIDTSAITNETIQAWLGAASAGDNEVLSQLQSLYTTLYTAAASMVYLNYISFRINNDFLLKQISNGPSHAPARASLASGDTTHVRFLSPTAQLINNALVTITTSDKPP